MFMLLLRYEAILSLIFIKETILTVFSKEAHQLDASREMKASDSKNNNICLIAAYMVSASLLDTPPVSNKRAAHRLKN